MDKRVILHSDLNNFYASCEVLYRPELRNTPVVIAGNPENRCGIILAKNYPAKSCGITTGCTLNEAYAKCPGLVALPPNYSLYMKFGRLAKEIYYDYASEVQSFGLDECWLSVDQSSNLFGDGKTIADVIRERIKNELGLTASIGVSFNKIFAKLGSDYKKPDATTVITEDNFREIVWPLPVEDLLYVGRATQKKLNRKNINTIGDLANMEVKYLVAALGKWGAVLHSFANGIDDSPVTSYGDESYVKSIGNSTTTPRDLENIDDVRLVFYVLADSVASRLREQGFRCRTVQIYIRDNELVSFEKQGKLNSPTNLSSVIVEKAVELFASSYSWRTNIRSVGVRGTDLVPCNSDIQVDLFEDPERRLKLERIESTLDSLRSRYGHYCIQRAVLLQDKPMHIDAKEEHVVHPVQYFKHKLPL